MVGWSTGVLYITQRTVAATRACIEIFSFALKKPAPATQATLDKAKRYCHIHRLMAPKQVSSLNRPQGFLVNASNLCDNNL